MPKLKFDEPGKHFYETGVDHGVLFVKGETGWEAGVVWNGLSAVTESPEGAEETAIYADNVKYLSLRSVENFNCTIEAYTYPDEFEVCDGSAQLSSTIRGVKIGQQKRVPFCFAYRTKKGSDENPDLGYIIHIVYNCTASPSEKAYATVNDSPEAITFSWEVTTIPVEVEGFRNTSHLEIDSTEFTSEAAKAKLAEIEAAIFGADGTGEADVESHVLMPEEVLSILEK